MVSELNGYIAHGQTDVHDTYLLMFESDQYPLLQIVETSHQVETENIAVDKDLLDLLLWPKHAVDIQVKLWNVGIFNDSENKRKLNPATNFIIFKTNMIWTFTFWIFDYLTTYMLPLIPPPPSPRTSSRQSSRQSSFSLIPTRGHSSKLWKPVHELSLAGWLLTGCNLFQSPSSSVACLQRHLGKPTKYKGSLQYL